MVYLQVISIFIYLISQMENNNTNISVPWNETVYGVVDVIF